MAAKVEEKDKRYFVTRESQENLASSSRKESYAGLRDLTDLNKIEELDIVGPDGTLIGIKNRVRAGRATFENQDTLDKKNEEEGKIVVYTTSFKGVRHTYEECRYVLTVFHNLRVRVEERDIYVHKFYQRELEERMGVEEAIKLLVPQVYISGQHIGGKNELEVLNETGELRRLTANIPRQETNANCQMCGGYEFIPCRKCGGSKDSVVNAFTANFRALKCTSCSENGMERCPACEERKATTIEKNEENIALKKERELREQRSKEKLEQEKRERIKKEALEAERQAQIEKEQLEKEKERKKERARQAKERKKRAAEVRQKIVADIARELEREKQWQAERDPESKETEENTSEHEHIAEDEEVNSTDINGICGNHADANVSPVEGESELDTLAGTTDRESEVDTATTEAQGSEQEYADQNSEFEASTKQAGDSNEAETHVND